MSTAEVLHRFVEISRKIAARGRLEGWARYENPGPAPKLCLDTYLQWAGSDSWLNREVRLTLQGEFKALGVSWRKPPSTDLFPADLWRYDPVTGKYWPGSDTYCFQIPYRHEQDYGDIKYIWEINRLQFLQPLALQVWRQGDCEALEAIEKAISSWYQANQPYRGLAWNSGIELALRAISLLVVSSLCGELLSGTVIGMIRAILAAHLFWLARYPSCYSSANNHLIAEAAGCFLISSAMPEMQSAARLETWSRKTLEREAEKQFHPDGVPAEQSPTYGAFSGELLYLCATIAQALHRPLDTIISDRLKAYADFIGWISVGKGLIPAIGDDDEGRVLLLSPHEPSYPSTLSRNVGGAGTPPSRGSKQFACGGYTAIREVKRGHKLQLVFDHGPLGYLSIAAHGHADALMVLVSLDDLPLFVDPGTYLYHSGREWRDWFRGTRAHNTLNVADADQSIISGPFNWAQKAKASLEYFDAAAEWSVSASHDGYLQRYGVMHRREIFSTEKGFCIKDILLGKGRRDAEIVFQLGCDFQARLADRIVVIVHEGVDVAQLHFDTDGEITVSQGEEREDGGWISPGFGCKNPAARIAWRGEVPECGVMITVTICD